MNDSEDQGLYKIVRVYKNDGRKTTIRRGVSLVEARRHCGDPETSSSTATSAAARRRTRLHGEWFDCYEACR